MEPEDNTQPTVTSGSMAPSGGRSMKIVALLVALLILILGGLWLVVHRRQQAKPSTPSTAAVVEEVFVSITSDGLVPQTINVKKDAKVTWTNEDEAAHQVASDPHPSHEGLKGLEGPALASSDTYSYTFSQTGTFTYHDHLNPLDPKYQGTVVVE